MNTTINSVEKLCNSLKSERADRLDANISLFALDKYASDTRPADIEFREVHELCKEIERLTHENARLQSIVTLRNGNTALIEALQAAHLALHLKSESRQRWTTHDQRAYEKVRDVLISVGAVRPISTLLGDRAQHDPSHAPRNDT